MPAPRSPEFRRRAVELARQRDKPTAQIARDLGIAEAGLRRGMAAAAVGEGEGPAPRGGGVLGVAESGLRRWMAQADVDEGKKPGLSSDERAELVRLRRENRTQAMGIGILKRASAYFARENVLPK